jgi:recombination associated protein RdgC
MWFKQAQLFQLTKAMRYSSMDLCEKLSGLEYEECLPSFAYGAGWIPPVDEEGAPLVQSMNGYIMICLQIEEKILPPIVIRQELLKKIKKIEGPENRKIGQKEKYALKDETTITLLPRAFSKLTKVYAYIDTKNHWLILGTANAKKTEQFMSAFKKTFGNHIHSFKLKKLSAIMTSWLKGQDYSSSFSIEKSCILQDANHESRIIRCHNQDLFDSPIQSLIKSGCEIKQLALNWQDRIDFILLDDLSMQSIKFKDEIMEQVKEIEVGTKQHQFNVDFLIMANTFDGLFKELLKSFTEQPVKMETDNMISTLEKFGS